jgi:hypothetical protein
MNTKKIHLSIDMTIFEDDTHVLEVELHGAGKEQAPFFIKMIAENLLGSNPIFLTEINPKEG